MIPNNIRIDIWHWLVLQVRYVYNIYILDFGSGQTSRNTKNQICCFPFLTFCSALIGSDAACGFTWRFPSDMDIDNKMAWKMRMRHWQSFSDTSEVWSMKSGVIVKQNEAKAHLPLASTWKKESQYLQRLRGICLKQQLPRGSTQINAPWSTQNQR